MFGFLQRKKQREAETKSSSADVYNRLTAAAAKAGDLSDADAEALAEAAGKLGIPLEGEGPSVEHHISLLTQRNAKEKVAAELPKAKAAAQAAAEKASAFAQETDRLVEELTTKRKAEEAKLRQDAAAKAANLKNVEITKASADFDTVKLEGYGRIIEEGPGAVGTVREEWETYEQELTQDNAVRRYPYRPADEAMAALMGELTARVARERRANSTPNHSNRRHLAHEIDGRDASGDQYPVLYIERLMADHTAYGDLSQFEFHPFEGQDADEFARLVDIAKNPGTNRAYLVTGNNDFPQLAERWRNRFVFDVDAAKREPGRHSTTVYKYVPHPGQSKGDMDKLVRAVEAAEKEHEAQEQRRRDDRNRQNGVIPATL